MGRSVHVWCFGHYGHPVVVFPSAAGFAHEWQAQGMVEALEPMIQAGRIKLYCPESNVAEAWTRSEVTQPGGSDVTLRTSDSFSIPLSLLFERIVINPTDVWQLQAAASEPCTRLISLSSIRRSFITLSA